MEEHVIECGGTCGGCGGTGGGCGGTSGGSLGVLQRVHAAYQRRMDALDAAPQGSRLQRQVELLRQWVSDLVGQNTLLARAVEDLEADATARLLLEKRRHNEVLAEARGEGVALRRRLARKEHDLRGLIEVLRCLRERDHCSIDDIHFFDVTEHDIFGSGQWLAEEKSGTGRRQTFQTRFAQREETPAGTLTFPDNIRICETVNELKTLNESLNKENTENEREIRRLKKDMQHYEQIISNLSNEIMLIKNQTNVTTKDAEVMATTCCTGVESGDWEPVKEFSVAMHQEMLAYQERIHKMEDNLKSSPGDVHALYACNLSLRAELRALQEVCAALAEHARVFAQRNAFKDDIVRELRKQLKRAKRRLKEPAEWPRCAAGGGGEPCSVSDDCRSPRLVVSSEELATNH